MTNLTETPTYEAGIYQLETTDPVVGGPDGIDNTQAKQLANRTAYLKAQLALLTSNNAGPEPAVMLPHMWWPDFTNDIMKQRNADNNGWISLYTLSTGASLAAGSVLQVINIPLETGVHTSSNTFTDVVGQVAITPKSLTSKMVVSLSSHTYINHVPAGPWGIANYQVLRDSTVINGSDSNSSYGMALNVGAGGGSSAIMGMYTKQYIDSPNSASEVIYKPQVAAAAGRSITVNHPSFGSGSLTVMEIAQ